MKWSIFLKAGGYWETREGCWHFQRSAVQEGEPEMSCASVLRELSFGEHTRAVLGTCFSALEVLPPIPAEMQIACRLVESDLATLSAWFSVKHRGSSCFYHIWICLRETSLASEAENTEFVPVFSFSISASERSWIILFFRIVLSCFEPHLKAWVKIK